MIEIRVHLSGEMQASQIALLDLIAATVRELLHSNKLVRIYLYICILYLFASCEYVPVSRCYEATALGMDSGSFLRGRVACTLRLKRKMHYGPESPS